MTLLTADRQTKFADFLKETLSLQKLLRALNENSALQEKYGKSSDWELVEKFIKTENISKSVIVRLRKQSDEITKNLESLERKNTPGDKEIVNQKERIKSQTNNSIKNSKESRNGNDVGGISFDRPINFESLDFHDLQLLLTAANAEKEEIFNLNGKQYGKASIKIK